MAMSGRRHNFFTNVKKGGVKSLKGESARGKSFVGTVTAEFTEVLQGSSVKS